MAMYHRYWNNVTKVIVKLLLIETHFQIKYANTITTAAIINTIVNGDKLSKKLPMLLKKSISVLPIMHPYYFDLRLEFAPIKKA